MRTERAVSLLVAVLVAGVLSGCTVSATANLTVPASDVAASAADALEDEIGIRPEMDCGDGQVDLVDGTVVDCVLTDPNTSSTFDAPVTIDGVDGTRYTVSVEVADAPRE
ncbi:DUF4333 domain-containing protein [Microbacterium sp. 1.5R]|uniref:DUF4333 domain-containing protein n=1 Tax=Microbacterium sp. 1.5R TaxID=1916917 RepID=UPI0011A1DF91|nr:DUF4333 domain-containing protein [Microbacterium sp. 1.5R]